jgi:glycosyltransferase involved in cell wall biosynthesis
VIVYFYLKKFYREKFVFDIRDYSMEAFTPFKKIVMKLINLSKVTTISSKGFMEWLDPSNKIIVNHNITYIDGTYNRKQIFPQKDNINITFAGNIRLDEQTTALLLTMKNSKKYTFGFIGRMLDECNLLDICNSNEILNYFIQGAFTNQDKPSVYSKVDIINAVYANGEDHLSLADSTPLPNRVYDAAIFKCPIVASRGTYLAELIKEYNLGFEINGFDLKVEAKFDEYINNFDEVEFRQGCDRFLRDILMEEDNFRNTLKNIFMSWKGGLS